MRWNVICLTAALSLWGCSEKAELNKSGVGVRLNNAEWQIDSPSEGIWKVGHLYRDTVSKSLTVVVHLPLLSQDDAEFLRTTYGIDAWVARVVQVTSSGSRMELAQLFIPFYAPQRGRTSHLPVKAVSFALTYAASAISERFRRFQCPAFSHDRRLKDWNVIGEPVPMEFQIAPSGRYTEKLAISELVPTQLNIGNSMVGDYYLEVALFNNKERLLFSTFQQLPQHLKVISESTVSISGCAGVHQEYDPIAPGVLPRR